jgi:hypothetical protein
MQLHLAKWSSSDIDKSQRRHGILVCFKMVYLVVYWPCLFSHFHGLPNAAIHLSQCLIHSLWAKGKIFVDLFSLNPESRGYIEICRPSMGTYHLTPCLARSKSSPCIVYLMPNIWGASKICFFLQWKRRICCYCICSINRSLGEIKIRLNYKMSKVNKHIVTIDQWIHKSNHQIFQKEFKQKHSHE